MKKLLTFAIIMIAMLASAFAKDKDAVFADLKKKIDASKGISFEFKADKGGKYSGSIKAKRGNKYVLTTADRKIVCDGKTVWNYSVADNKVIISDFDEDSKSMSIENIFFSITSNFTASKLTEENDSKRGKSTVLYLKPSGKNDAANIDEIKIYLDTKSLKISAVSVKTGGSEQAWKIVNLKTDVAFDDSIFKFNLPKDCEKVDLR